MDKKSQLVPENKLVMYKTNIIKHVWIYGIKLWRCANRTNIEKTQPFQNKVLRAMVNIPEYETNADLLRDLRLDQQQTTRLKTVQDIK